MSDWRVIIGDVSEVLPTLGTFDAVLCDPPYGLTFMGRDWDKGVPSAEVWSLVLDRLRPGAHLMAFGGPRTQHRLGCAIEDAGAEIRDVLCWLFGSGFPKSHNALGTLHEGYGTALKPAYEPVILARKPFSGSVASCCVEHGTGALNIDGARIETGGRPQRDATARTTPSQFGAMGGSVAIGETTLGRWPANVVMDEKAGRMLDQQSGELTSPKTYEQGARAQGEWLHAKEAGTVQVGHGDTGGASRFFYCAKASRAEREAGLQHREPRNVNDGRETSIDNAYQRGDTQRRNVHPTVKPVDLNRWLATLLLPPPLDRPRRLLVPFSGSGSEMIGALLAGWDEVVGVELSEEYADIARARLAHWQRYRRADSEAAKAEAAGQLSMFDAAAAPEVRKRLAEALARARGEQ